MKSILIIGMGRFGHHLAANFLEHDHDVMIVDEDEEKLADMVPYATSTRIGDCTNEEVLKSIGVRNFDVVFVCIGTNFQSSLEITSLVKELGAKRVVSKVTRDIQAKFLLRNGADEVIYPDRDIAERLAFRHSANHVFDYIELTEEYSIYEIPPMQEWIGRSIRDLNIRATYHVNILGIKKDEKVALLPPAEHIFVKDEHLMVIGLRTDLEKVIKHL